MRYGNFKDKIESNASKIAYFVQWYVDTNTKDRTIEDYDTKVKGNTAVTFDYAMSEWLIRPDVQDAIREYMKQKKFIKIVNIYDSMYEKALTGDVQASKFVIDFSQSEFFQDAESEVNEYLDGINIPGLNGSDS